MSENAKAKGFCDSARWEVRIMKRIIMKKVTKKITAFLSSPDNWDKLVLYTILISMVLLVFILLSGSDAPLLTVNWK